MNDMEVHLREAIALNTHRMHQYGELTNGQSLPFSRKLIYLEKFSLVNAKFLDFFGNRYQRRGVPLIQEDVVSMNLAKDFSEEYPFDIRPKSAFIQLDIKEIKKRYYKSIKQGGYGALVKEVKNDLEKLNTLPEYHCMVRHILESLIRLCNNTPFHVFLSKKKGLESPLWICHFQILTHIFILGSCHNIDKQVLDIQSFGVPFLYQDLPHIGSISEVYKNMDLRSEI